MEVLFKGYFDLDRLKEQVQKNKIEFEINVFFSLYFLRRTKRKNIQNVLRAANDIPKEVLERRKERSRRQKRGERWEGRRIWG